MSCGEKTRQIFLPLASSSLSDLEMSALLKLLGLAFALSVVCTDTALNSTLFFVVPDGWILKEENTSGRDICLF